MSPQVLNLYHLKDGRPKGSVYIGRPSPLGNPFVIGRDGTREEVIEKYRVWINDQPELVEQVRLQLRGKDLVCYCAPRACELMNTALSALPPGILLAHLFGDYIFQNDWLAAEKTKHLYAAIIHGLLYGLAYQLMLIVVLGLHTRPLTAVHYWMYEAAILVIIVTHIFIDRYRLVKHLIWLLNQVGPREARYSHLEAMVNNGYSKDTLVWMRTWLMIIVDNSVHLLINTLAIYLLIIPAVAHG